MIYPTSSSPQTHPYYAAILLTILLGSVTGCAAGNLQPRGPMAVGTRLLTVNHPASNTALMAEGHRHFPARAWYPIAGAARDEDVEGAPIKDISAPVVVLIHGTGGERLAHHSLARDLASRGFLVIAADHIGLCREGMDRDVPPAHPSVAEGLAAAMKSKDILKAATHPIYQRLRTALASDVRRTLQVLPELIPGVPPVTRFALVGHSFGGMVALDVCREDRRCTALVDLDGPPLGDLTAAHGPKKAAFKLRGFDRPLLVVATHAYRGVMAGADQAWDALDKLCVQTTGPCLQVYMPGAGHLDVTEVPLMLPPWLARRLFGGKAAIGDLDPTTTVRATNDIATAFLERWHAGRARSDPHAVAVQSDLLKVTHRHGL